jgi:hypothetical protein
MATRHLSVLSGLVLLVTACTSSNSSLEAAALEASDSGDQAKAISLTQKEIDRLSAPDQCSSKTSYNCGTLALAYSSLAGYQILNGDKAAGESSFGKAKEALKLTAAIDHGSATGMVYHDVSEAYWKVGDKARAVAVLKEGKSAGGDGWLMTGSAAHDAGFL